MLKGMKPDQPVVIPDFYAQEGLGDVDREMVQRSGVRGVAGLPLAVGNQWVGIVTASSHDTFEWSEEDLRQVMTLTGQAATVIQTKLLFERAQTQAQREQALRQITEAVRGSTDPATIMRTAVRELGTALGRRTQIRFAQQTGQTTDKGNQNS